MICLDRLGRDAAALRGKRLFLLDMDGTIYMENSLYPGALPFLRQVKARGGRSVFVTNNSSRSAADYCEKLRGMGIAAEEEDFFTSSQAAAMLLKERFPGGLIYCQGTRSLLKELERSGIRVTTQVEPVDAILVGFDTEVTGEKLRRTSEILTTQPAAPFLATNPDLRCPVSFGYIPDCGSMCIGLQNATGRAPEYIGKPQPAMILAAMAKFGAKKEETVVIGDRLYTDIASGKNAGVTAVMVLSGEASLQDLEESPCQPDYVFDSIGDLLPCF